MMDVLTHYDLLIAEDNDPFRDPPPLQAYMAGWDGQPFLDAMELAPDKRVLEIGIGTGRIAAKVAPRCARLTGIDLSPKTIARAGENLIDHPNITLICGDFLAHAFEEQYDVIYSSLTMMHFENKGRVLRKVASLLRPFGIFVLSLDKNQSNFIDMGTRKLQIYPDTPEGIIPLLEPLRLTKTIETVFAHILVCKKGL